MKETCIQRLFLPELFGESVPLLYFRGSIEILPANLGVRIPRSSAASADTYFNSFPLEKWKRETDVRALRLKLVVEAGSGLVQIVHRTPQTSMVVARSEVQGRAGISSFDIDIDITPLETGILYWQIEARDEMLVRDISYVTTDPPIRHVQLGIAAPTFRREAEARDLIARFKEGSISRQGHKLHVIDNGGTLSGDYVVPNTNSAGGTGGYTRGILLAQADSSLTHVLLMDDDAPSPFLSVEKCAAFLRFVRRNDTAVAGAMLVLERPEVQYGTSLRLVVSTPTFHKPNRDMTHIQNILVNDAPEDEVEAGGWYFFAFPVAAIRHLPFPYFVRGDDVLFCLQNKFHIVSVTGVACWQTAFEDKISPSTTYLAYRARLLNGCLKALERQGDIAEVYVEIFRAVRQNIYCFRYGYAGAILDAIGDVLEGPDFFKKNTSAIDRLNEMGRRYAAYYPQVIPEERRSKYLPITGEMGEDAASAGAVLISGFACPPAELLEGRDEVLFWSPQTGTGFVATRSDSVRDAVEMRTEQLLARMRREGASCFAQYHARLPELQSPEFWHRTLEL